MNFDMFSNKRNDDMDPNYIYPQPYIDPTMYVSPYGTNPYMNMDPNMNMSNYITYMNPYVNSPFIGQNFDNMNNLDQEAFNENMFDNQQAPNMMPGMPNMMFPPGMMMPGMMPQQGMMPNMMFPYMMMPPGMMPGAMPNMMFPYMMMPGMTPINMEEFDEEEM